MIVLIASAAVVVIGLAAALAFGAASRMSVRASEPVSSAGGVPLPPGRIGVDDLARVRFDTAFRGYRMDQVDAVLDRMQARLAELEGDTEPRLVEADEDEPEPQAPFDDGDPGRGADSSATSTTGSVAAFPRVRRHGPPEGPSPERPGSPSA
ncbi:DivIVA domain-containing protein [Mobilicoccus sp.]|uniref:DivIVA domain-containing protein n=1 Tax=Mobilicoccus sp. TaxID=2034349 RepID=UPI0028ACEA61|nr:DivIVA domain-containing protein [Mobilicoccus sp.]